MGEYRAKRVLLLRTVWHRLEAQSRNPRRKKSKKAGKTYNPNRMPSMYALLNAIVVVCAFCRCYMTTLIKLYLNAAPDGVQCPT